MSKRTIDRPGGSVTSYVDTQLLQRNVTIAVIPYTTSDNEAAMVWAITAYMKAKYSVISHNCSTAVGNALNAGGIPVQPMVAPGDMINQVAGMPGVQITNLGPGDAPPDLSSFNQH